MISLPKPPKVIEKKENQSTFVIEGLYPGYGITIGNTLRRVLLSSLPGAAITRVNIKGVQHEFATLSGVMEDVINICLNLKNLRFKLYGDEPQRAVLKVHGEKDVEGSDFELPSQIELINKDLHIATLTDKKADLEMEILVEKGVGYEPREMREKEKLEIGQISLDAIYTPVKNVNYRVENMRVGERTDFDRLFITVKSDGTISPEQALIEATEILVNHFSLIFGEKDVLIKKPIKKTEKKVKKVKKVKKEKPVKKVEKKTKKAIKNKVVLKKATKPKKKK
jgi:DNA-directed RNA polymerase subunit alpha